MIVLNITTASHGLRPARDLRDLPGRRYTASNRPRNHPVGLRQKLVIGVKPGIPLHKINNPSAP